MFFCVWGGFFCSLFIYIFLFSFLGFFVGVVLGFFCGGGGWGRFGGFLLYRRLAKLFKFKRIRTALDSGSMFTIKMR